MSNEILEERVGKLEGGFSSLRTDVAVLGRDVADVKTQGAAVLAAIGDLKQRDAARPQPVSVRHIMATLAAAVTSVAALAVFVWWFVGVSPAVTALADRVDQMDRQLERAEWKHGWTARVDR